MNKHNKSKFKEVSNTEIDKQNWDSFLRSLSIIEAIGLSVNMVFKTRRACLFMSYINLGMNLYSSHGYAFKLDIKEVCKKLFIHGWQISESGKLI